MASRISCGPETIACSAPSKGAVKAMYLFLRSYMVNVWTSASAWEEAPAMGEEEAAAAAAAAAAAVAAAVAAAAAACLMRSSFVRHGLIPDLVESRSLCYGVLGLTQAWPARYPSARQAGSRGSSSLQARSSAT